MLRQLTLVLCLCCSLVPIGAQEVILSEAIPLRNEIAYYIIGKMGDRHLVLRERPSKFTINAYNSDMTLGWEKDIELAKRRPEIIEIWDLDNRFYILYVHRFKGDALMSMHKYDARANLVDSTLIKNLGSQFLKPEFNILQSENKKNVQIELDNGTERKEIMVINLERMELLYETEFNPADFNSSSDFSQLLIDDEGTSYYIVERDNRRYRKKTHHFAVYAHESYTDRQFNYQVNMSGRMTYDVAFAIDNLNHNLVGGGYFSDKTFTRANGTFYIKTSLGDPTSGTLKFKAFDDTLLETVEGKNRRQKRFLSEIRVKELILRRDGGALIVGEKFKRLDSRVGTGSNFRTELNTFNPFASDFYFDDIFIVAHHPDGETHWTNFFYKRQYSKNDLGIYSSYFVMKTPSQLRFLFNDEIVQNTTVSTYNVAPGGEYDRKALLNANFQNIKLRFISSKQVGANEIVVPSEFKNELRLLRVVF